MLLPRRYGFPAHGRVVARRATVVLCAMVVMLCAALPAGAVVVLPGEPAANDGAAPDRVSALVSGGTATGGDGLPDGPELGAVMQAPGSSSGSLEEWSRRFPGTGSARDPYGGLASKAMVEFAAMGAPPRIHNSNEPLRAASLMGMMEGLVTVRGASAPGPRAAKPAGSSVGGDPLAAMLQPLAVQVLEAVITDIQPVDGRTIFSVFGGGAFVLEVSRNGTGLSLSELDTGTRIVIGGDPGADVGAPRSRTQVTESARSLLDASVAIDDQNPIEGAIGTFTAAFGAVATSVRWFADSPLRVLLLLPLVLLAAAAELMRRGRSRDTDSQSQEEAKIAVPEPAAPRAARQHDPEKPRRRRRRRRSRRKKGVWRALIRSVRESLGFPSADQLRETDYKMSKRKRSRRRAHGAV